VVRGVGQCPRGLSPREAHGDPVFALHAVCITRPPERIGEQQSKVGRGGLDGDRATHITDAVRPALRSLAMRLRNADWNKAAINQGIKETIAEHGLKMPQLAVPVRVLVCGRVQTPSIDAVLELFSRDEVLYRLQRI